MKTIAHHAIGGLVTLVGLAILASPASTWAQDAGPAAKPTVNMKIWPGQAPGETAPPGEQQERVLPAREGARQVIRLTDVTEPSIAVYAPAEEDRNGAAVVICPGGGYSILAMDLEGTEVADWLTSIGVTAVVLKYRVPKRKDRPKHQAPLQDAQRAVGLVRYNAEKWKIDPKKIGILGFSAGGHLSAAASTNYEKRTYQQVDAADQISCRPDFAVLVYPAYLVDGEKMAPEIRVTKDSPPTFLVHASDDRISPANSARMYLVLRQAGVPAELHIYGSGGHGFGLRESKFACSRWPERCERWLEAQGLLPKLEPARETR